MSMTGCKFRCLTCAGDFMFTDPPPEKCDDCDGAKLEIVAYDALTDWSDVCHVIEMELENRNHHSSYSVPRSIVNELLERGLITSEAAAQVARVIGEALL